MNSSLHLGDSPMQQDANSNNNTTSGVSKLEPISIKRASLLLRSVNHKLRQSIVKLLEEQDRMTVTEIYVKLRLEQSVASQHLAILRRGGFVDTIRDGKNIYYSVNKTNIDYLQNMVNLLVNSINN